MLTRRKPPPQRERPDRSEEFASFTLKPTPARMFTPADTVRVTPVAPKVERRVQQAIRDSARGEDCLVRLPGCPANPEFTIWSHNRHGRAGKGRSIKAIDLNGAYACGCYCDAIYDGQMPLPAGLTREDVELAWYHAHAESLVRLRQKGLV